MPRLRSQLSLSVCLLVAALVLICTSSVLAQSVSPQPAKPAKTMTWKLTDGSVVDSGQQTADGQPIFVGKATATAQGHARVNTGVFSIRYSVKNGEMRGAWDITREGAAKTTHHTPDSIKGTLVGDLSTGSAKVMVTPKRRHAGNETKAAGTFTGNEKFEGTLSITRK